jgi:hypothetical protein
MFPRQSRSRPNRKSRLNRSARAARRAHRAVWCRQMRATVPTSPCTGISAQSTEGTPNRLRPALPACGCAPYRRGGACAPLNMAPRDHVRLTMAFKPSDLSMRRPTRPNQHRLSFVDFRGNARYVIRGMRVNSTGSSNRGEPSKIPDGNVLSGDIVPKMKP